MAMVNPFGVLASLESDDGLVLSKSSGDRSRVFQNCAVRKPGKVLADAINVQSELMNLFRDPSLDENSSRAILTMSNSIEDEMAVLDARIQRLKGLSPVMVDSILEKKSPVVKDPIIMVEVTESKVVASIAQPMSEGENDGETEDGDDSEEDEYEEDQSSEMGSTGDLPNISEKDGALDEEEEKGDNTGDNGNYFLQGTNGDSGNVNGAHAFSVSPILNDDEELKIEEVLENKRGDDSHLGEITRGTESAQNALDKMPTPTSWATLECPQLET
ncbi:hypothetical protein U1Q18_028675 [Sarracenia purpurea var. burkii]